MFLTLIVNPDYHPSTPADKAAFEAAKKAGPLKDLPHGVAMDNVRLSNGLYMVEPKVAEAGPKPRELEDMTNEELKVLMLQLGVKTEKQMKKAEILKSIRIKLAEIDITDDA